MDKIAEGEHPEPNKVGLGACLMIEELKRARAVNTEEPKENGTVNLFERRRRNRTR